MSGNTVHMIVATSAPLESVVAFQAFASSYVSSDLSAQYWCAPYDILLAQLAEGA